MKFAWQVVAVLAIVCLLSGCKKSPDEQYIHQKMPIEIQSGKPVTIEISSLSGNGVNEVGIRCSPDAWQTLGSNDNFAVRLLSSNRGNTEIINVTPGDHKLWPVESFYYLFSIGGHYGTNASVEITFDSAPEGVTHLEIIVLKTPADTGL